MKSTVNPDLFINRHLGLGDNDERIMLHKLGFNNIDQFINQVIPEDIQLKIFRNNLIYKLINIIKTKLIEHNFFIIIS